jgi:hypothetical protein
LKPTPLDWFLRLDHTMQAALRTGGAHRHALTLVLRYTSGVSEIDMTDARTIANANLLLSKGLSLRPNTTHLPTP